MDVGRITSRTVNGAVAGDLVVTGIAVGDQIISVQSLTADKANIASEFTITAADTINNAGGTSTAAATVLVTWYKNYAGRAIPSDGPIGRSSF